MTNLPAIQKWLIAFSFTLVGILIATTININDSALDLLPGKAVRGDLTLLQKLGLIDRVIISLSIEDAKETASLADLKKSALSIGKQLDNSQFFSNVIYHLPQNFELQTYNEFQTLLPYLIDSKDLLLLEPLTEPAAIKKALQNSFNLLNSPAGYGMKQQIQKDPLGLTSILFKKLQYLQAEYSLQIEDGLFLSRDKKSSLIIAESTLALTDADSAAIVEKFLLDTFHKELASGITPRIIGSLPHTLANAESVQHDLKTLLPVATLLLLSLLLLTLRNIRALLVLGIPFLAAPTAIAFTGVLFNEISALALGFGIVLLGIAVDFAVHIYIGLAQSSEPESFLTRIRRPILMATLTTTSVFVVLLFSQVPSHRQMATLALSGVLLAVVYSWYLVPLIAPKNIKAFSSKLNLFSLQPSAVLKKFVLLAWVSLLLAGVFAWPHLQYNGNLQTLDAPSEDVIQAEEHFRKTWGGNGDQAFLVASGKNLDEALHTNYLIFKELIKHQGSSFQSIAPLLPSLADQAENLENWQKFWLSRIVLFRSAFNATAMELGFSEIAFAPFFNMVQEKHKPRPLLDSLPDGIKILADTMIRLPEQQRGRPQENKYLIATTVSTDDALYDSLLNLDKQNPNITLLANKKWKSQVEGLLRQDIISLSLAAALVIGFITFLCFRSLRTCAAVLAPVLSALSAMALFSSLTGKELNMMHLLMGIMVIGLAVDYGIFTACSFNSKNKTSSQLAISICAMSSLIGFGVLSFAQHPALSSLGITVLIGIGAAWPTSILVSPIIMAKNSNLP